MTTISNVIGLLLMLAAIMDSGRPVMGNPLMEFKNRARFNCPSTTSCSCTYIFNDYEISCPEIQPSVIVKTAPGEKVEIECMSTDEKVYTKLPEMNLGDVTSVQFRRCPLPMGSSLHRILERLGVRRTRTMVFLSYGADLGGSLVRQHLSGLHELQRLVLSGNGLSELPDDLFDDVGNLTWLDLRSNKVHLPVNIFRNLHKLEYLELGYNNLNKLENGIFRNQHNLKHLNLWGNNLQHLTKDSFLGVSSIVELDLSDNKIETLQPDVFEHLTNLTNINLNANRFSSLPTGLFSKNKNLKQIRLMDNRIALESLPSGFLSALPELEEVNIRCNVKSVPGNMFTGSSNIRNVTMASNALTMLPAELFADQTNLLDLDLSDNQLYELPDDILMNTRSLIVLRLSNNQLSKISGTLFRDLVHLSELYLDNNNLVSIHRHAFSTASNLEKLRLENNQLSFDDISQEAFELGNSSPFQHLTRLKELNLRNNSIMNVLMDWNYNNLKLQDLDLSYNKISRLSYGDLQFLSSQITVNLTHNSIMEINLRELEGIAKMKDQGISKTHLILNDNPLQCDCVLIYFVQFLRKELAQTIRERIQITADNLKCAGPERMANKSLAAVQPSELLCLLDSPNSSIKRCPVDCECYVRPSDRGLIINCSNTGITQVPHLPNLEEFGLKFTELFIENNNISRLPHSNMEGYNHVVKLHARNNSISHILPENLPIGLMLLDVSENRLKWVNSSVFWQLNRTRPLQSISLSRNPWVCDCRAKDLYLFIKSHFAKVIDFNKISCENGELLTKMNDLCPQDKTVIIAFSILIALFGLLLGAVAALYYKYQQEVKVWLYAHNICLWLVTEEDLDKDKKYDAFISFSHKDEEFVTEHLVPELETGPNPYKICLHFRDWVVGEFIPNQISQSVEDSRRTIVVLTPNFLESIWGRMEFRAAHKNALNEGRARVIVILYGDMGNMENLDPELKAYLNTNTYVKWGDPWFFDKLRYALPHRNGFKPKGLIKSTIKSSIDDKLELIKPQPVTPPLTTPPADIAGQNPLITKLNAENGKIIHNGTNGLLNGHVNGAFIINTNAKQSDV